jgi:hypothetical protein
MSAISISPSMTRVVPAGARGAARAVSGASTGVSLHLTSRGRRVLVLLAVLVLVSLVLAGRAVATSVADPAEVRTYTVSSGDTLWSIAAGITGSNEDVRDIVIDLKNMNRMASADLRAGEQILLPVRH